MKTLLTLMGLLTAALVFPARAELMVGDKAPDFETEAAMAGDAFHFSMAEARSKGPVVVYFYPAAFTPGCTVEANEFAQAIDDFAALGATVIGVSADDIATLKKFSVKECQGKFAVAADEDKMIIGAYDAAMERNPEIADRTSYVISPEGEVLLVHTDMNPRSHVTKTMAAVKDWAETHKDR